jgi:hypothetical protein
MKKCNWNSLKIRETQCCVILMQLDCKLSDAMPRKGKSNRDGCKYPTEHQYSRELQRAKLSPLILISMDAFRSSRLLLVRR